MSEVKYICKNLKPQLQETEWEYIVYNGAGEVIEKVLLNAEDATRKAVKEELTFISAYSAYCLHKYGRLTSV